MQKVIYGFIHEYALFLSEGNLYSATVADFQAKDPLIMESEQRIRTIQHDSNMLNGRSSKVLRSLTTPTDWNQGPVVQCVVSLMSLLRVISLTVLADSIYNILIFFAEKMWVAFALQKLLTFFQQKISAYLRITGC